MRLILYRGLAGGVLALVVALWFYMPASHSMRLLMVAVAIAFLVLLATQWLLAYSRITEKTKVGIPVFMRLFIGRGAHIFHERY